MQEVLLKACACKAVFSHICENFPNRLATNGASGTGYPDRLCKPTGSAKRWRSTIMRTTKWMCTGIVTMFCFGVNAAAAQHRIEGLPINVGATYEDVKGVYQTDLKPQPASSTTPGVTALRLRTKGVWFFFGEQGAIYTIRLDAPFSGNIGGVKIGDTFDEMTSKLGNPMKVENGPVMGGKPIFTKYIYYPDDVTTASIQLGADKKVETVFLTKRYQASLIVTHQCRHSGARSCASPESSVPGMVLMREVKVLCGPW
jgi:hypothetical protein